LLRISQGKLPCGAGRTSVAFHVASLQLSSVRFEKFKVGTLIKIVDKNSKFVKFVKFVKFADHL